MRTFAVAITLSTVLSVAFANPLHSSIRRGLAAEGDVDKVDNNPQEEAKVGNANLDAAEADNAEIDGKEAENVAGDADHPVTDDPSEAEEIGIGMSGLDFNDYYEAPYECNQELIEAANKAISNQVFSSTYVINNCADECAWTPGCKSFSYGKGRPNELLPHCMMFSEDKSTAQENNPDLIIVDPKSCDNLADEFLDPQDDEVAKDNENSESDPNDQDKTEEPAQEDDSTKAQVSSEEPAKEEELFTDASSKLDSSAEQQDLGATPEPADFSVNKETKPVSVAASARAI